MEQKDEGRVNFLFLLEPGHLLDIRAPDSQAFRLQDITPVASWFSGVWAQAGSPASRR